MFLDNLPKYDFKKETVDISELVPDGEILVCEMNAAQAMEFSRYTYEASKNKDEDSDKFIYWMTSLCASCMIKENGEQLINIEHHKELVNYMPLKIIERIYEVAAKLNGYAEGANEAAKK